MVIGDTQLEWSDDQSEGALYAAWREEKEGKGHCLAGLCEVAACSIGCLSGGWRVHMCWICTAMR